MTAVRVQERASSRLDEIYRYTASEWGEAQKHFVYWKKLANGDIGIVNILHERMHHIDRFRDDFGL